MQIKLINVWNQFFMYKICSKDEETNKTVCAFPIVVRKIECFSVSLAIEFLEGMGAGSR